MSQDQATKDIVNDYANLTNETIEDENKDVQKDVENKITEQSTDVDTGFLVGTVKEGYSSRETGDQLHDAITQLALDDFPELMTVQDDIFVDGPTDANSEHLAKICSITSQIFGLENDLLILYVLYVLGFKVTKKETVKIEKIYKQHVLLSIKERISAIAQEGGTIFKNQEEPVVSDNTPNSDSSSSDEDSHPDESGQEGSNTSMGQNGSMTEVQDTICANPSEEDVKSYLKQKFTSGNEYVTVPPTGEEPKDHGEDNNELELGNEARNKVAEGKLDEIEVNNRSVTDDSNDLSNTNAVKETINFEASTSGTLPHPHSICQS